MKYKEVEEIMLKQNAVIRINDWYTSRPMYELYTVTGKKLANLQYKTVLKLELKHKTKLQYNYDYKLLSIIKEKKGE